MGSPTGKSKLDERNNKLNEDFEKGLNLTDISKLIYCNRQTLAN